MAKTAFVMNMFYTGLGISRSLGKRGIPVVGLTSRRGTYGNFTRYAKILRCPDSREQPDALLEFLLKLGREHGDLGVLFPTRDDDLAFLDRFRTELAPFFSFVMPHSSALQACLNKWETYRCAERAGVATPRCWLIECDHDLRQAAMEVKYPCVLKPLSARHWRHGHNWRIVGERKAIPVFSEQELSAEYKTVGEADKRAVIQEMITGTDDSLIITACYVDQQLRWVGGFNLQKLLQVPEGFGTGCIVQVINRSELYEPTARLLSSMGFSGIAEVEYKWDAATGEYKLIEVNPRPWDQHRLGNACGVDLIYLAYCDHAGIPIPVPQTPETGHKWVADDTFAVTALRLLWRRDPKLWRLFHQARGKRIYAIWSALDPLPSLAFAGGLLVGLSKAAFRSFCSMLRLLRKIETQKKGVIYETDAE
jgi:D-aspartate ligase